MGVALTHRSTSRLISRLCCSWLAWTGRMCGAAVASMTHRWQVLLVLEDHQFLDVAFFEMINSLLSTGEVMPVR